MIEKSEHADQPRMAERDALAHRERANAERAALARTEGRPDGGDAVRSPRELRISAEDAARQRAERGDISHHTEAELRQQPEQRRIIGAAGALRDQEWLQPERWEKLDESERRAALSDAGRSLRDTYECADPPVLPKDFPEYSGGKLLGFYADGATKGAPDGDYELALNKDLMAEGDPREALGNYLHEFRHAYQHEMATRYEKPQFRNFVHDVKLAEEWSANFHDYQESPPEGMAQDDPAFRDLFDRYENQPVERDAREFSQRLLRELYRR